jgi:hypothetical protein
MGLGLPNQSQIRCITSAEALLDVHRVLYETASFAPSKRYTYGLGSFHAFHVAAVLAVALSQPIYRLQYEKFRTILHATLERLETTGDGSPICSKAARSLEFLL